jgi:hypothetical protein
VVSGFSVWRGLNEQAATERLHKTVFYYEDNEFLKKYTGDISILPNGVVAPTCNAL